MSNEKLEMDEAKSELAEEDVIEGKESMDNLEMETEESESKGTVACTGQESSDTIEKEVEKSDPIDAVSEKSEESKDNQEVEEAAQMEADVDEKKDVSEESEQSSVHAEADLGAKPKENKNSSIRHNVQVKLLPDVEAIRSLLIFQNGTVQIFNSELQSEYEVTLNCLRWVTTYTMSDQASHIVLSFYGNHKNYLSLLVFRPETDSDKIYTTLKDMIDHKYTSMLIDVEGLDVENLKTALAKQPIYMGWVNTSVGTLSTGGSVTETYWMILDIESLCWYECVGGPLKHCLMFWKEASPNSIEIMRHNFTDKKFEIQTKTLSFTLPDLKEMDKALAILQPKERYFLKDGKSIIEFFKTKAEFREPIDFGHGSTSTQAARQISGGDFFRIKDTSEWDKPVSILIEELNNAEEYLKDQEQFQIMWITYEEDLRAMMIDQNIPRTEIESMGLSPENPDHLYKAVENIEDMFKENSLHLALSRMQACRRLFSKAMDDDVKEFFRKYDDLTLLKKIYFKSLSD